MTYYLDIDDITMETEESLRRDYAREYEGKPFNRYASFEAYRDSMLAVNGGWLIAVDEMGKALDRIYKASLVFESDYYTTDAETLAESIAAYAEDIADPDEGNELPTAGEIAERLYALSADSCLIVGDMEVTLVA